MRSISIQMQRCWRATIRPYPSWRSATQRSHGRRSTAPRLSAGWRSVAVAGERDRARLRMMAGQVRMAQRFGGVPERDLVVENEIPAVDDAGSHQEGQVVVASRRF